jgi:hypothetical protein
MYIHIYLSASLHLAPRAGNAVAALLLLRLLEGGFASYGESLADAILSLLVGSIVALIACVVPWTERATVIVTTRLNHFGGYPTLCDALPTGAGGVPSVLASV